MGILIAIFVLAFLIFFHELGHFLIAKLLKVKVEVFSIGFGKKIVCKKYGETDYCLSLIPFGGYVQMKGQDDTNPTLKNSDKDSYNSKTPFQRILILLGGPLFNIMLAFFIYLGIALTGWQKLKPVIGEILPNSSAEHKLKKGDIILKIDNHQIKIWDDIHKYTHNKKILRITIKRDGKILNLTIKPKIIEVKNIFGEKEKKFLIGIQPANSFITIKYNLIDSFKIAINHTIETSKIIFQGLWKLISGVLGLNMISGPITIVKTTSDISNYGITPLLLFTALISINLGILNLLPIPALDGGHILFNSYEMIFKKEVNETIMYNLTIGGWILLFGIMSIGFYNDISRIISGF